MKCFYHSADLDGHCSGAIVKRAFPSCEMVGINYGHDFPWETIKPEEQVFMVDFALQPFLDMIRLEGMCHLTWVDHHQTAISDAIKHNFTPDGRRSVGMAGCELTWRHLFPEKQIPRAVYLLGRYDVWDHSDEDALPFQYGMRQLGDTRPDNQSLWSRLFNGEEFFMNILGNGDLLLKYETTQNEKFCRAYAFETRLLGLRAICCNRGFTNSKIFDSVYDESKHDMMITFCRLPRKKQWTVSMYTTKDAVDCGMIAKGFGGGGHKQAAGFQCENLPFEF
jgi:oligoribonuclease NrnB/cAMP/cGMP phosphodiesterase (DHH superfamily)